MTRCAAILVTLLVTSPALAGSPDNPGGGGQFLKQETVDLKAAGSNVGERLADTREVLPGFNLGQHIQEFGARFLGSTPNPANDQGSGND